MEALVLDYKAYISGKYYLANNTLKELNVGQNDVCIALTSQVFFMDPIRSHNE